VKESNVQQMIPPAVSAPEAGAPAQQRFRGSTARTHRLAEEAASRHMTSFCELRRFTEEAVRPEGVSAMLAEATIFAAVRARLTPVVHDDELLVGAYVRGEQEGWSWFPDGNTEQVEVYARNAPPDRPDLHAMAQRGLFSPQGSFNHKVVDYAHFIRCGSAALIRRAEALAAERTGDAREFAQAFALGHRAIIAHAHTYADACTRLAEQATPERAAELHEMARICRKAPECPAETFHEALQSLWFAYLVAGDALGRPDVYLDAFYQADLAAGRITPERALELIECLLIKVHGDTMQGDINVSSVQTMTLGGVLEDGADACNTLTRLFLQAARNIRLLRPTIYVRCHEGTPEDVLALAVTMLGEGLAEPNFYGDRPVLDGLVRLGLPLEVARDYALSGCAEVVSPGRGNWGAPNGWINLALLVDEALREYAQSGGADLDGLWATIARHMETVADACRDNTAWLDTHREDAALGGTLLMPVCLERCCDLVHGGAETYYGHWEAMGLPNAADMLYAAEQLAFDADTPLASLFARLDAGDPALQARLRALPKFGNDVDGPDRCAARLVDMMAEALERRDTSLRTALVLGHLAGGENMHICYGLLMGPTLDGRLAGQTLADSLAGAQGRTTHGPTAIMRSLCRLDHSRLVAGNVSTLQIGTAEFATPESRQRVIALIRAFVALGGSQLQFNVADVAALRRAQDAPEAYRGLMVRVGGYSADFTHMGRRLQDEIIARMAS